MGLSQILLDANICGFDFLITEIDTGMTFLDVAESSHNDETVRRNHENAVQAYRTVERFRLKVNLDSAHQIALNRKLAVLKKRLEKSGYSL